MLKISATFGALALALGLFAASEQRELVPQEAPAPVLETAPLTSWGDTLETDAAPMSIQTEHDLYATIWTEASCKEACLKEKCRSWQYIGRPGGGGSCTCSNCSYTD